MLFIWSSSLNLGYRRSAYSFTFCSFVHFHGVCALLSYASGPYIPKSLERGAVYKSPPHFFLSFSFPFLYPHSLYFLPFSPVPILSSSHSFPFILPFSFWTQNPTRGMRGICQMAGCFSWDKESIASSRLNVESYGPVFRGIHPPDSHDATSPSPLILSPLCPSSVLTGVRMYHPREIFVNYICLYVSFRAF